MPVVSCDIVEQNKELFVNTNILKIAALCECLLFIAVSNHIKNDPSSMVGLKLVAGDKGSTPTLPA